MKDKYFEDFLEIKKKSTKKKGFDGVPVDTFDVKKAKEIILLREKRELTEKEVEKVMRIAHKMMKSTKKISGAFYGYYILLGAEYAEKVGKGGDPYIKRKLFEAFKRNPEAFDTSRVESFFIRNRENATKLKNIFRKIFPKINYLLLTSIVYFTLGITFFTFNITGNVIGFKSGRYTLTFGIVLFFLGIMGYYLNIKRNHNKK